MQQIIYLQPEDDLPAIRHLLEGLQAKRALLVLPRGYQTLRDPLQLRLLRRFAADLAVEVALVTGDSRTRELARAEGVATVRSVAIGRWDRWRGGAPSRSASQRAAASRVAGLRAGRGDPGYRDAALVWAGRVLGVLLFVVLLAAVAGLAFLTVPEARITVVPLRQTVETSLEIRADPNAQKASLETLTVPARLVEVEVQDSGQTPTLSTKDAPDEPAKGTLTLINQTAAPHQILPGLIVRTSTGSTVRFRTVSTVTLEANVGARAQAEIEAVEAGPAGNVPAATINTVETPALRGKLRVINEEPTRGGGVKQVGVVTRADMDRLKAQLLQQLQQRAYVELQGKLREQEFLPPESMTVEIVSEVYDQFLDATADVLNLTMRIYATGTAVDKANARLLAFEALEKQVPSTYQLNSDAVDYSLGDQVRMDGRSVLTQAGASAQLVAELDRRQVRSVAAGLPSDEAEQALMDAFALDARPSVIIKPDWISRWKWLNRVPYLPFRIQVVELR
jgi:hypothetical protein